MFLTPHGVKLLDFGLARPAPHHEQVTAPDLTRVGTVVGTPSYMAPEQVVGESVDPRTDLFAVGAMLFEMLAGRKAFVGATAIAILHATVHSARSSTTRRPAGNARWSRSGTPEGSGYGAGERCFAFGPPWSIFRES